MPNGLYSNSELLESLVIDLNNVIKEQMNGQYIKACGIIVQMSQKLINLRKTIDSDLNNRNHTIELLKEEIRSLGGEMTDIPANEFVEQLKKDGANLGER